MARIKRIVAAKDYDTLVKNSEEKILKLTNDLKEEKINLKNLKKDRELYIYQKEQEEKEEKMKAIVEMITSSGKTMEEIEAYFSSIPSDTETENETE